VLTAGVKFTMGVRDEGSQAGVEDVMGLVGKGVPVIVDGPGVQAEGVLVKG